MVDVRFVGNRGVSDQKLRTLIQTRADRAFESRLVQADVRRLFNSGLVRDVQVLTQVTRGGVVVTFEVFERPTIRSVLFIGNRVVNDKNLLGESGLSIGSALNSYAVEDGRRKLQEFYREKGLPQATVTIIKGTEPGQEDVVYYVTEGYQKKISEVRFVGNDPALATEARLKTKVKTKPGFLRWVYGGEVKLGQIDEDCESITAYYRSLGFFQTRVGRQLDFDNSRQWLTVTFVIDEGPRYVIRSLQIEGHSVFSKETIAEQLSLTSGDYFNLAKMGNDVRALKDLYGTYGYIYTRVTPDPRFTEQAGELDLLLTITEGEQFRVGKINVHVNGLLPHTRHDVILNRLSFVPGELVDSRQVRTSERLLKRSQLFVNSPAMGTPPRIVIESPTLNSTAPRIAQPPAEDQPSPGATDPPATFRGQNPAAGAGLIDRGSVWRRPASGYQPR